MVTCLLVWPRQKKIFLLQVNSYTKSNFKYLSKDDFRVGKQVLEIIFVDNFNCFKILFIFGGLLHKFFHRDYFSQCLTNNTGRPLSWILVSVHIS